MSLTVSAPRFSGHTTLQGGISPESVKVELLPIKPDRRIHETRKGLLDNTWHVTTKKNAGSGRISRFIEEALPLSLLCALGFSDPNFALLWQAWRQVSHPWDTLNELDAMYRRFFKEQTPGSE